MFSDEAKYLTTAKAQNLKAKGITDVFVCTRDASGTYHLSDLQNVITLCHKQGIKVHAWIACFKSGGNFVNPSTSTSTTTKTVSGKYKVYYKHYYKVYYKHYYKHYYKYKGKWYYKWKYYYKYYTKYTWKYYYKYTYKTVTSTSSYQQTLINNIANIAKNYNVDGISLDYVRYPGTAYKYFGASTIIANFVSKVNNAIGNKELSCVVMSEGSVNAYYYGQDYSLLTKYCDFLLPMTYKGNYGQNDAWITSMTKYIVAHSNGKPVFTGLTTYYGDNNLRALSSTELKNDVLAAKSGGAKGYCLFKYDYGCTSVPSWS